MNATREKSRSTPLQRIFSVVIGPLPDCRERLWSELTAFHQWPEILGKLSQVQVDDQQTVGRGTKILLNWNGAEEDWAITHWHPGQCLEVVHRTLHTAKGYRFDFLASAEPGHIRLVMEIETEYTGLLALIRPLLQSMHRRQAKTRFRSLVHHLQNLSGA